MQPPGPWHRQSPPATGDSAAQPTHTGRPSAKVWLEALRLSDLWNEVKLEHALVVRISLEDAEDE